MHFYYTVQYTTVVTTISLHPLQSLSAHASWALFIRNRNLGGRGCGGMHTPSAPLPSAALPAPAPSPAPPGTPLPAPVPLPAPEPLPAPALAPELDCPASEPRPPCWVDWGVPAASPHRWHSWGRHSWARAAGCPVPPPGPPAVCPCQGPPRPCPSSALATLPYALGTPSPCPAPAPPLPSSPLPFWPRRLIPRMLRCLPWVRQRYTGAGCGCRRKWERGQPQGFTQGLQRAVPSTVCTPVYQRQAGGGGGHQLRTGEGRGRLRVCRGDGGRGGGGGGARREERRGVKGCRAARLRPGFSELCLHREPPRGMFAAAAARGGPAPPSASRGASATGARGGMASPRVRTACPACPFRRPCPSAPWRSAPWDQASWRAPSCSRLLCPGTGGGMPG